MKLLKMLVIAILRLVFKGKEMDNSKFLKKLSLMEEYIILDRHHKNDKKKVTILKEIDKLDNVSNTRKRESNEKT